MSNTTRRIAIVNRPIGFRDADGNRLDSIRVEVTDHRSGNVWCIVRDHNVLPCDYGMKLVFDEAQVVFEDVPVYTWAHKDGLVAFR